MAGDTITITLSFTKPANSDFSFYFQQQDAYSYMSIAASSIIAGPQGPQGAAGVSYWTQNGSNILNNNIGNVGIGFTGPTNNPTRKLHVFMSGPQASQAAFTCDQDDGTVLSANGDITEIKMNNSGKGHYTVSNDGAFRINNTENATVAYTPGENLMSITRTGDVGIGLTGPTSKLHVVGTSILDGNLNVSGTQTNLSATNTNINGLASISSFPNNSGTVSMCAGANFTGTLNIGTNSGNGSINIGSTGNTTNLKGTVNLDRTILTTTTEMVLQGNQIRIWPFYLNFTGSNVVFANADTLFNSTKTTIASSTINIGADSGYIGSIKIGTDTSRTLIGSNLIDTGKYVNADTGIITKETWINGDTVVLNATQTTINSKTLWVESTNITLGTKGTTIISTPGTVTATSFTATSDYRTKQDIYPFSLEEYSVDKLKPVKFKYTSSNQDSIGLIAHEVQEHYPFLVEGEKDGEKTQSVNYMGLIGVLIKEVQELKKELHKEKETLNLKPSNRPETGEEGTMYYDKDKQRMYYKDGIGWVEMGYENF